MPRLLVSVLAALVAFSLTAAGQPAATKAAITPDDLTFIGAFKLPGNAGGDSKWGRTLTHRYVGSTLRLMSMSLNGVVYEVTIPALRTAPPWNEAPVVQLWRGVTAGKQWTGDGHTGVVYGLYWDEPDRRLYWSYGNTYNTCCPDDPSLGYSTLDDASGQATPVGVWKFSGRGAKMTMGGVTAIPQWFADAYTQGRRLGVGFGGYWSIVATGPASIGPALIAIAPPDPARNKDRSGLPFTTLVGYPYNGRPYGSPDRAHRDTDYTNDFDGWNPRKGVGYWSWSDYVWQSAVWVDTPARSGLLVFNTLGNGRTWYETSTLHAERTSHALFVYDTSDLAAVATRKKREWEIQPEEYPWKYAGLTYPLPGWADEPWHMVTGVSYDARAGRLYVAVRFASEGNTVSSASQTVVYVYAVAGTAPAALAFRPSPRG